MTQNQQIKQIKKQLQQYKEIAQTLVDNEGFYQYWFEALGHPEYKDKTKTEIFEIVNKLYARVFNKPDGKYSSYKSFTNTTKKQKNK